MEKKNIEELEDRLAKIKAEGLQLVAEIEQAKKTKHAENVGKVLQLMKALYVTFDDIKPSVIYEKKISRAGKKRLPKYSNPATHETWAGSGGVPNWLKTYEAQGRKREEFLIKN